MADAKITMVNGYVCAAEGHRRTPASTGSHQINKGHYATPRQNPQRLRKGLRLQPRSQPKTLARVGFVVQLGQPGWSWPVLYFLRGSAVDSKPGLRLEVAPPARQTAPLI